MVAQQGQPLGIEFVDTTRALSPVAHQAGLFQHAKVLRDRRTRNRQGCGELVHRARRGAQHLEDSQAGGVAKGAEAILYVSVHLR